ncbi:hypothetical protein B0H67DRAFT_496889, partial [Lasiosphaeris hirsuta]
RQWEWPSLQASELEKAIMTSNPKKAPGPDRLSFGILQRAYAAVPMLFYRVYNALFSTGAHPEAWKECIGIVLPKMGKPDYTVGKAYRIIALLNCLSKVLEKIFATRLSATTCTLGT